MGPDANRFAMSGGCGLLCGLRQCLLTNRLDLEVEPFAFLNVADDFEQAPSLRIRAASAIAVAGCLAVGALNPPPSTCNCGPESVLTAPGRSSLRIRTVRAPRWRRSMAAARAAIALLIVGRRFRERDSSRTRARLCSGACSPTEVLAEYRPRFAFRGRATSCRRRTGNPSLPICHRSPAWSPHISNCPD